jgi:hypothetical protein
MRPPRGRGAQRKQQHAGQERGQEEHADPELRDDLPRIVIATATTIAV